jgi:RNase H-like domain found in reverse transcriptase
MERPQTAADLQQFLCGSNWLRTAVPNYAQLADPLLQLLRRCQDAVGKTKTRPRSYGLSQLWWSDADRQFKDLWSAIVERVTLSHPDLGQALCMHTDVSQEYYAAALTQMPQEDLEMNADEQRHEPLVLISGRFVKAMYNWSVPEKEAFAIVAAMTRLRYLTIMRTVHVHTDHRNLTFIYDPKSSNPNIASYVASKLQRWGVIFDNMPPEAPPAPPAPCPVVPAPPGPHRAALHRTLLLIPPVHPLPQHCLHAFAV